jgi:hypothetical protein
MPIQRTLISKVAVSIRERFALGDKFLVFVFYKDGDPVGYVELPEDSIMDLLENKFMRQVEGEK